MDETNTKTYTEEEFIELLKTVYTKLKSEQVDLEPEFQNVIDKHFWELVVKT